VTIFCRWDVQRIREQRLIEKLKQRQERLGSASRTDEQNDLVQSLCPNVEDVKYLEVSEQLPVSAFGSPVPKISPR
jgi:male-specific lethal 1